MRLTRPVCVILLFLILDLFTGFALAGDEREIELDDGSLIYGEIVSFQDGMYKIKSETLGTMEIEGSKILAIRSKKACKDCKELKVLLRAAVTSSFDIEVP